MYKYTFPLLVASALCAVTAFGETSESKLVLSEDFEQAPFLFDHPLVKVVEGEGMNGTAGLEVRYEGYEHGSRRVVRRVPLGESGTEYTFCYDVKFAEDFQFVGGGKLHGFGPERPISGGGEIRPDGWSARVNFASGGGVRTYLYEQDQPGKWGTHVSNPDFSFERGTYHAVSFHVQLNDPEEANGFAHIYVNGEKIISHDDVRFRGEGGDETLISYLLVSTFHGGSTPKWAPVDDEGNYTTVKAWFDNLKVHRGMQIRENPGSE